MSIREDQARINNEEAAMEAAARQLHDLGFQRRYYRLENTSSEHQTQIRWKASMVVNAYLRALAKAPESPADERERRGREPKATAQHAYNHTNPKAK